MYFPSLLYLGKKISEFEQKVAEKIGDLKAGHPLAAAAINALFAILPPPLDAISSNIFYSFDPTYPDRTDEVLRRLDEVMQYNSKLKDMKEDDYNEISSGLNKILANINDSKKLTTEQLGMMQDILITKIDVVDQKLNVLKNDIDSHFEGLKMGIKDVNENQNKMMEKQNKVQITLDQIKFANMPQPIEVTDKGIFSFFQDDVFRRPAFRGHYTGLSDLAVYDEVLRDISFALTNGIQRSKGVWLKRYAGRNEIKNKEWRLKVDEVIDRLSRIKVQNRILRKTHLEADPKNEEIRLRIDNERDEIIKTLNIIWMELGLEPLPIPTRVEGYAPD